MDFWEAFQRLGLALVLTLPLAVDRELRGKEAGLRTNVLVAVTCAALGYLSVLSAEGSEGSDGTRIASQTVTGIGFIGAGIIWAGGGRVRGLTTAAAAFASAAIGLVSGMGERALAITLAAAVLFILWPTHWVFSRLLGREARQTRLVQLVVDDIDTAASAAEEVRRTGALVERVDLRELGAHTLVDMTVAATATEVQRIAAALKGREGVVTIADSSFET